jgi:hypothetical protein
VNTVLNPQFSRNLVVKVILMSQESKATYKFKQLLWEYYFKLSNFSFLLAEPIRRRAVRGLRAED